MKMDEELVDRMVEYVKTQEMSEESRHILLMILLEELDQ